MTRKQKAMLEHILLIFIIYVSMAVVDHMDMLLVGLGTQGKLAVHLIPYILIGWDVVYKALRNTRNGQVFDENFLMAVAIFGAFGIGEYSEAAAVTLFYQVGGLLWSYAVDRSRQSITELMDICPEYVDIEEDGQFKQVDPDDTRVGDITVVRVEEGVSLDGRVVFDNSMVDTSVLTSESVPGEASVGDGMVDGCINRSGLPRVQVTGEFDDSTAVKILELAEDASSKKAQVENLTTGFARYYTPVVIVGAVILVALPSLVLGQSWAERVGRACTFLAVSCPCTLAISVPINFFSRIGVTPKRGALIRGSNYLEVSFETNTIVFDKTGALTESELKVTEIHAAVDAQESLLELAALVESYSSHPISRPIKETCDHALDMSRISDTEEVFDHGVKAAIDGHVVLAGNSKLMKEMKIGYTESPNIGTAVYIAMDGTFYNSIIISDIIKEEVCEVIESLKRVGIERTVTLTSDRKEVGKAAVARLGLDEVHAELLPDGKVVKVGGPLAELKGKDKLAFVGDGTDDISVLSRADIGIAMGSMGSDAAIETVDIVLMNDDSSKVVDVVRISRKTTTIVKQNTIFALGVKAIVFPTGVSGMIDMWEAVFVDVGMSMVAIINAMRALSPQDLSGCRIIRWDRKKRGSELMDSSFIL